ncbi:MAG TPA: hypothetical protein DCE44_04250 [Verrucomicrobiales bacterium]|nr:hypothetical protein [Verrucomicrobiales bacterium]
MDPNGDSEETIFTAALGLASPAARAAYLDQACADNPDTRRAVEELLRAHEAARTFIDQSPLEGARREHDAQALRTTIFATSAIRPEEERPGTVIGRYKLLEKIGEGGFGEVYVAEQREPVKRKVALKIIKLGMDTRQVVARFEAERQALALMDHPNIAKVLDAGATETGRPYFVMELVRGIPITKYCDDNQLDAGERLRLFTLVCHAIQHAHQKGVIHRDIKPSNILVTLHDGVPVPKVIDFGIAKATQGELTDKTIHTQFQQFIGTPAYVSPEQAEMSGLDIDTRSDIYALGVLLYELLVGKTPFDGKEMLQAGLDSMRRTIREQEPVRPSTRLVTLQGAERTSVAQRRGNADVTKLAAAFRGDLDWIVMKCLEKDRTRRYETANGLAADILRHLGNEPVVARPPTTAYRLQKAIRRNKVVFAAGALVAVALVVGIGVSTWQAVLATRARTGEREQRLAAQAERDKAQAAQQEAQRAQKAETAVRQEAEHQLYAAKMNLAQQAWDENNMSRLRQMLDDTQDSPYRGFEWYYWQQQAHLALRTLRGHASIVFSVAYSKDGRRIVTGSYDHTAKVWDATTGKELLALKGHDDGVVSVAFSPDGQRIATGSWDKTAKVWEAASARNIITLKGHHAPLTSIAYSPDSQRIVTGSHDTTAKVWDATTGKEILTLKGHSTGILSVAFSQDGHRIVTGGEDQIAKVWDAATGMELLTLKGHSSEVSSGTFSPDDKMIVTGSHDRTAKVWDAATGMELLTLKGHSRAVSSGAFSPDGQKIVTGSYDRTAKVWDAASGGELLTLKGHADPITSVAFSQDGQKIMTGSYDRTVKVWAAVGGGEFATLKGHSGQVFGVAFSSDGQRIVTSGGEDKVAKVWEATSGRELLTLKGHTDQIASVAFSPDGQRIATGSGDNTAKVWAEASGQLLMTLKGHNALVTSATFSPDGQRIATGSWDKTAKVWEAASGRELLTLKGHSQQISAVAFSPGGQQIATGSGDSTAKIWEAVSGRELLTLKGHAGGVASVAFSPNGQRIVTGSFGGIVKIWDAVSGTEQINLMGHTGGISSVAFSPDGQRIVTSGWEDETIKVWDATSGRELLSFSDNNGEITSVTFSPDGHRIAAGIAGTDLQAKVWGAARAEQVAAWQEEERAAAQSMAPLREEFLAEQERQRIDRERSSIKQWLVMAPIALAADQSGAAGLEIEQIEGESRLKPKAGEARSTGGRELKWQEVTLEGSLESLPVDFVIDFNAVVGSETAQSVAYAVCYLRSDAPKRGLQLLVGSDDEAKIYLNGKEVYRSSVPRPFSEGQDTVPDIALNAGVNVLVFKVVNEFEQWQGCIRLTDAHGNPVKGVEVTLDPEPKEREKQP